MIYECHHAYKLSHSYQMWASYESGGIVPDDAPIIDVFVCLWCGDISEHYRQPNKGNSVDAEIEAGVNFIMDTNFGGE